MEVNKKQKTELNTITRYILAFDIETLGPFSKNDIIGIGVCVISYPELKTIEKKLFRLYFPNLSNADEKCMKEFWFDKEHILEILQYRTKNISNSNESILIDIKEEKMRGTVIKTIVQEFIEYIKNWEMRSLKETYKKIKIVTDCTEFDVSRLNELINEHTKYKPFPYSFLSGEFNPIDNVSSMQKQLVAFDINPGLIDTDWGLSHIINTEYTVPKFDDDEEEEHVPTHDALNIARDYGIIWLINERKIIRIICDD